RARPRLGRGRAVRPGLHRPGRRGRRRVRGERPRVGRLRRPDLVPPPGVDHPAVADALRVGGRRQPLDQQPGLAGAEDRRGPRVLTVEQALLVDAPQDRAEEEDEEKAAATPVRGLLPARGGRRRLPRRLPSWTAPAATARCAGTAWAAGPAWGAGAARDAGTARAARSAGAAWDAVTTWCAGAVRGAGAPRRPGRAAPAHFPPPPGPPPRKNAALPPGPPPSPPTAEW